MKVLPVLMSTLESCLRRPGLLHPDQQLRFSTALLKASALELAIVAGHLFLYPSGIRQERPTTPARPALEPRTSTDPGVGTGTEALATTTAAAVPKQNTKERNAREQITGEQSERNAGRERSRARSGPVRLPSATAERPVVLLHGFIDNRSVFVLLRRTLAKEGRQHLTSLNYSPLTCDIRSAAERLARHVEEICERTGQPVVDIVGHSLGGLIARYYVQRLGGDVRVRTLVTLGSPHSGTQVVPLMSAHPIVRQMRPDSDVIEELREPAPHCRTRFVCFWSDLDTVMSPLETACIDHPDLLAHNVRVTGIGHLALPVHPAVAVGIRQAIDSDDAIAPTASSTTSSSAVVA